MRRLSGSAKDRNVPGKFIDLSSLEHPTTAAPQCMQRQFKYFIELRSTRSGLEKNGVFSFWCLPTYLCDDGDDPSQFRATVEYLGRRNTFLLFSHLPRGMCDGQRNLSVYVCFSKKKLFSGLLNVLWGIRTYSYRHPPRCWVLCNSNFCPFLSHDDKCHV